MQTRYDLRDESLVFDKDESAFRKYIHNLKEAEAVPLAVVSEELNIPQGKLWALATQNMVGVSFYDAKGIQQVCICRPKDLFRWGWR